MLTFIKNKKDKINQKKIKYFRFTDLKFGTYGLKVQNACLLTNNHLNAVRKIFIKNTQKSCSFWLKSFPVYNKTKKPKNIRMGKGKGKQLIWICRVYKGTVLFELDNIPTNFAKFLIKKASNKLPVYCQFTKKLHSLNNFIWIKKSKILKIYKKL